MKEQASAAMTVGEVLQATGGRLARGKAEKKIRGVSTDSRQLQKGNLFLCLRGEHFDGHDFLAAAAAAGAAGFVIQRDAGDRMRETGGGQPVVLVEDTLQALGDIARYWRRKLNIPVIAITGSSGKTTTKEMVAGILGGRGTVLKSEGNLNNQIGLPLTLLKLAPRHDVAVVEMGTNRPGEIGRLTRIAEPRIGLITNIGAAHLEGLKTLSGVLEEKGALYDSMDRSGIAVMNRDDRTFDALARRWPGKRICFAWKHPADVCAFDVRTAGAEGMSFRLRVGGADHAVRMQVSGRHNLYDALAAAAAAMAFGAGLQDISRGLESFRAVPGRFEIRTLRNGAHVIDDSYNANPLSVREALEALGNLRGDADSIAVLGDMLELGGRAAAWHRKTGRHVARTNVQTLVVMGAFGRETAAGALEGGMPAARIFYCEDAQQVLDRLASSLKAGDWVLVKGSRKMKMEHIVRMLGEAFGVGGPVTA